MQDNLKISLLLAIFHQIEISLSHRMISLQNKVLSNKDRELPVQLIPVSKFRVTKLRKAT